MIDSPRERLIAILTNNFSLCNGRWPTQILMGTIFIGAAVPKAWAGRAWGMQQMRVLMSLERRKRKREEEKNRDLEDHALCASMMGGFPHLF